MSEGQNGRQKFVAPFTSRTRGYSFKRFDVETAGQIVVSRCQTIAEVLYICDNRRVSEGMAQARLFIK